MANDINMWNDLENMDKRTPEYAVLFRCYQSKFIEGNNKLAEEYKKLFEHSFHYWGNYY